MFYDEYCEPVGVEPTCDCLSPIAERIHFDFAQCILDIDTLVARLASSPVPPAVGLTDRCHIRSSSFIAYYPLLSLTDFALYNIGRGLLASLQLRAGPSADCLIQTTNEFDLGL